MTIIRVLFFFIILFGAAQVVFAECDMVPAKVVRVIDGDTIVVNIASYPPIVGHKIGIRLAGCDTAELKDKNPELRLLAKMAKAFVADLLEGKEVELSEISRGKYFRLIARVNINGNDVSALLIKAGLAVPYDGGRRPDHARLLSPIAK